MTFFLFIKRYYNKILASTGKVRVPGTRVSTSQLRHPQSQILTVYYIHYTFVVKKATGSSPTLIAFNTAIGALRSQGTARRGHIKQQELLAT